MVVLQVAKPYGTHQTVSALQRTHVWAVQPNSLPALPSTSAWPWLQAAARQTSHAVLMVSSAVSQPQALVWLVAGVVVLQLLLWMSMKLVGLVLHAASSVLAWLWRKTKGITKGSDEPRSEPAKEPGQDDVIPDQQPQPPAPEPPGPGGPPAQAEARMIRKVNLTFSLKLSLGNNDHVMLCDIAYGMTVPSNINIPASNRVRGTCIHKALVVHPTGTLSP